jgi:hypothetical protein
MEEPDIYELDEAGDGRPRPAFAPKIKRARPRPFPSRPRSAVPAAAGSLSLLLPGAGQMLLGEVRLGLFFVSGAAFLAALTWAIFTDLDRLIPTLEVLGVSRHAVAIALATAFVAAVALHLGGVVQAHRRGCEAADASASHPLLSGLASLLVPGWGQLLGGHRRKSALFLGATWALAAAWIAVSPPGQRILSLADLALPAAVRDGWGPIALVSVSAVLWVVAVHDAIAGARVARGR